MGYYYMKERDRKFITNIVAHINSIEVYMDGILSLEEFSINSLIQDAVVFNLLQIGELAKTKISDRFKKDYSDIPWNKIYGFRNRLVHDYENIILTVVYDVLVEDLPLLKKKFESI